MENKNSMSESLGVLNTINFDTDNKEKIHEKKRGISIVVYSDVEKSEKNIVGENPMVLSLERNVEIERD